jgi:outer membrane protein assembly factor BamA
MRRILLLLVLALPLTAQSRRIDTIDFRGSNVPRSILLAESTLTAGRDYSDEELAIAVARIRRLPFVYDASYTVDGTTLVINILSEHRLFYAFHFAGGRFERHSEGVLDSGVGGRLYVPSGGVAEGTYGRLFGSGGDAAGSWHLQYAQYAIGGSGAFVIAGVGKQSFAGTSSDYAPHVTLGYRLGLRQTITASGRRERQEFHSTFRDGFSTTDEHRELAEVRWTYDTTDDPFFITRGLLVSVAPQYNRLRHDSVSSFRGNLTNSQRQERTRTLNATSRKYWNLGSRNALFGGVSAEYARTTGTLAGSNITTTLDVGGTTKTAAIEAGAAHNSFDLGSGADTHHRVDGSIAYVRQQARGPAGQERNDDFEEVNLGYAFRHRWGSVRVSATWSFGG